MQRNLPPLLRGSRLVQRTSPHLNRTEFGLQTDPSAQCFEYARTRDGFLQAPDFELTPHHVKQEPVDLLNAVPQAGGPVVIRLSPVVHENRLMCWALVA